MIGTEIPLGDTITLLRALPEPDLFRRPIRRCYIHTAAATRATPEGIHRYHTKHKGWSDIGYHFCIAKDGTITVCRPVQRMGAGVKGDNRTSVHICMLGHGDKEAWTDEQSVALGDLAHDLWAVYEIHAGEFYGHREYPGVRKTCPGKLINMESVRLVIGSRLRSVSDWEGDYPDEELLA